MLSKEYNLIKKVFQHVVLEGTSYKVGQQLGEILKKHNPETVKWFVSAKVEPEKLGFNNFEDLQAFYEEYCPGIYDEILGLADCFGAKLSNLQVYNLPVPQRSNCSQFTVLSSVTNNKHVYVGRSYEYNQQINDFRLCTVRIKGKVKHIGFMENLLGRDDGMNEFGLCVTFSGGGTFKKEPTKVGFPFFLVVRTLLDNCKTVVEAVKYLEKMPVYGFWNFLLTDKSNNAALMQYFDGEYGIKQINKGSSEQYLYSTNHYVLPDMVKYQKYAGDWILRNSKKRYELIENVLSYAAPKVSKENIKNLLSKELYSGVCGHYYTDYFGTLFSVIYDLTDLKAEVCFGAPTHNKWQKPFSLKDPVGVKPYLAILPDKPITHDELWQSA
jgi:predicted choloylglycine hydrolase